ncbi:MAG: hypothetical protein ABIT20_21585 [Gemmatimonadaceae bacterium]
MRTATSTRTFRTAKRQENIGITGDVARCRADDDFVLVSAMHISASVLTTTPWRISARSSWATR